MVRFRAGMGIGQSSTLVSGAEQSSREFVYLWRSEVGSRRKKSLKLPTPDPLSKISQKNMFLH